MDALPLPPRPNLEQYKKRAKDLARACKSGADGAIRAWATEWLESLATLHDGPITPFVQGSIDRAVSRIDEHARAKLAKPGAPGAICRLADAQFLIARAHGFESWPRFARHIESVARTDSDVRGFETAADAAVTGDLAALESLLRANPALTRARSTRAHRATLLHYVSANGVEDFRQKTPTNAVSIATTLLGAGAEVDALAGTYGGGKNQTTMNLLVSSTHPAEAGVQVPLVETLLDFGAAVNGVEDNESPLMTALAFGYTDAAEALARRGARVDSVLAAAALGRADLIRRLVADGRTLEPHVPLVAPGWFRLPNDPKAHIGLAMVWACKLGRTAVVELLLKKGVDPTVPDGDGQTGLHWAAAHGYMDVIDLLLAHDAALEAKNKYDGTVLDQTLWFARNDPTDGVDYSAVVQKLIDAGARVDLYPSMKEHVNQVLRRQL